MFAIKSLMKLLQVLNSQTAPSQLAAGLAFGMIVGLSPFFAWHNLLVFLLVCLFRVNLSMFLWSIAVFSILGFLLDPLFDRIGYLVLVDLQWARPWWIWIASAPILPYFRLNNTVVMGSLVFSLVLYLPMFLAAIYAIKQYRSHWREHVAKSKIFLWLKTTKLFGLYSKYQNLRDRWGHLV